VTRIFPLLAATLVLGFAPSAAAQTTHQVDLAGVSFTPADLTIAEGDTVLWNWVSGVHNVSSDDGLFRSGNPVSGPNTFSITFDAAFLASAPANGNVYNYFCEVHVGFGMVGSVTVITANPVLTITNFVSGQTSTMTVTNAGAGALVGFAYSLTGAGPVSLNAGPCGLITASLSAPITLLPQVTADAAGTATLPASLPAGTAGMSVWVQALDISNCQLSNGASMTIG
jgi:plastocyanin